MKRDFLTFEEVQELLKLSRSKLYQMLQGGELPAYKIGKKWRIDRTELEEWIESKRFRARASVGQIANSRDGILALMRSTGEILKAKGIRQIDVTSLIEAVREK